jgi:SAM-dependent methyltransferase
MPNKSAEKNLTSRNLFLYTEERLDHWEFVARQTGTNRHWSQHYHKRLAEIYKSVVAPGQRILELGCGQGDLLAALDPRLGIGIDISPEMIRQAKLLHPNLHFIQSDVYALEIEEKFDVIILSDLVNDLWDVQAVLKIARDFCTPRCRVIINTYSRLWEYPLSLARKFGLAKPILEQNWLTKDDIVNMLYLEKLETIRCFTEILWPLGMTLFGSFFNKFLVKLWPFKMLGLTNFIIARPYNIVSLQPEIEPSVSVIIPARNEEGHVPQYFERIPRMGSETEIVFVEGHSQDDTFAVIEKAIRIHPEWQSQLHRQTGIGKGDAVRLGFERATGDILMILDGDLTVAPEDLPRFYEALASGMGEFINGVRLVYPMEKEAMRFLNLLGNKFFSLTFSWLLGQPIKDTLCGTKVLWKADYNQIAANRSYFGDFDPFGDFDLIFGAAKLNMKIVDIPIRYRDRTYGSTNISRWKHGWLLLRMVFFAAARIKFV